MNDEIKEILEEVNKIIDNTSYNEDFTYFQTSHISKLLDYITNLQQENEKLKHQLKVQEDLTIKNRMRKHIYKSRCEKAIEYINKNKHLSMFADCREPEEDWNYDLECSANDLLNILQNGSDE